MAVRQSAITCLVVGPMQTNCYIVCDQSEKKAVIIDPGADAATIRSALGELGCAPVAVINTHGHADHIGADSAFNVPISIHSLDEQFLVDPEKNLSAFYNFPLAPIKVSRLLEHQDKVQFGKSSLEVIHTPGHTPGSISLIFRDVIFTGDTLFSGGIGRTDFPYGDESTLIDSIRKRLLVLDGDMRIHPGHGPASTIGREKKTNPFLSAFAENPRPWTGKKAV